MAPPQTPPQTPPSPLTEAIKQHNHCFGCGTDNPQGLHLAFTIATSPEGTLTATSPIQLTRLHEGPPGHIHGGIIATLLDEAMSKLNKPLNQLAMTRSLSINYLRPAPLETPLTLIATHLRQDGRKLHHTADLINENGTILAHAEGLFLVISPEMLARAKTP